MFDIPCLVVFPGVGRDGIDFCDCREVYIYIYIFSFGSGWRKEGDRHTHIDSAGQPSLNLGRRHTEGLVGRVSCEL